MNRGSGELLRGLICTVLATADQPITTSDLRRGLGENFKINVTNESIYRSLVVLQSRGEAVRLETKGRDALWVSPAGAISHAEPPKRRQTDGVAPVRDIRARRTCIKLVGSDGTLLHMNRDGCQVLGLPEDETDFGMPWLSLLPADARTAGVRALEAALEGRRARFTGMIVDTDGAPAYWHNALTPIEDDSGRVREVLCISRDVTDELADVATQSEQIDAPGREADSGSATRSEPTSARAASASFADRLNRLFAIVYPPGHGPYTNAEVMAGVTERGEHISAPYLSQLRRGTRSRPSDRVVAAIADFFGVRDVYFGDPYHQRDIRYLERLRADLTWLELARNVEVRRITEQILSLTPSSQSEIYDHLAGIGS